MAKSFSRITLKSGEKISFITNLSTMLSAGIPIVDIVDSLLEDTKGNLKKVLESLKTDLMQGKRMYVSLSQFPAAFDPVTVNLIKASEEAGTLETTLKDLRTHIQREMEFIDRIKSALIYPIVILCVFVIMLLVILIFVIPKIAGVFKKLKIDLPLPTKIMVWTSDIMVKQTIPLLLVSVLIIGIMIFLYKKKRSTLIRLMTDLPLISRLTKEIDLTRFSRTLYLLLSAGLPIVTALELSQDIAIRKQTSQVIKKCRDLIAAGKRFSDGLRTGKGYIPSMMIKLSEAGEKSGALDKSMQDVSEFLDYQVSNTLKNIIALMEPLMLVLVGLSVGAMMMAIISPIYGLIGKIGGR